VIMRRSCGLRPPISPDNANSGHGTGGDPNRDSPGGQCGRKPSLRSSLGSFERASGEGTQSVDRCGQGFTWNLGPAGSPGGSPVVTHCGCRNELKRRISTGAIRENPAELVTEHCSGRCRGRNDDHETRSRQAGSTRCQPHRSWCLSTCSPLKGPRRARSARTGIARISDRASVSAVSAGGRWRSKSPKWGESRDLDRTISEKRRSFSL
jgi:hypothetical protein